MKFRFDEDAIKEKFYKRLDEYMLGVMLMRPKHSKKTVEPKIGMKIIMTDELVAQNNEDCINIIVRQMVDTMAVGVAKLYGSTSCVFVPSPLEFSYAEGEFEISEGVIQPGTEVTVITNIETK